MSCNRHDRQQLIDELNELLQQHNHDAYLEPHDSPQFYAWQQRMREIWHLVDALGDIGEEIYEKHKQENQLL